jgi:hypothetical protein
LEYHYHCRRLKNALQSITDAHRTRRDRFTVPVATLYDRPAWLAGTVFVKEQGGSPALTLVLSDDFFKTLAAFREIAQVCRNSQSDFRFFSVNKPYSPPYGTLRLTLSAMAKIEV